METRFTTPKGLRRPAQGCRPRLPWVNGDKISNPEGVASSSPGLPSAATLGKWRQDFQPRRGCVVQPRVAVRGYPGKMETRFPTPKGLRRPAQGCRPRLPWENGDKISNPEGVASSSPGLPSAATLGKWRQDFQPRRGCVVQPRVAADGNPGLLDATPSGLDGFDQLDPRRQPWLLDATLQGWKSILSPFC